MLRAAEDRYRYAARLAAAVAVQAGQFWDRVPLGSLDSWQPERLASRVAAAQLLLARRSDAYVSEALDEQGLDLTRLGTVNAESLAGSAGDGRSLVSLLDEPRIQAKTLIGQGLGAQQAWDRARSSLRLMSITAVQDAGRAGDSIALVAHPAATGYVRMLSLPSCARCTILAGKFYRWNSGFQRHPRCDCRHVPSTENVAGDLRTSPRKAIESGQVTGLSRAERQAVVDGADPSQVVNAHRGMQTADVFGRRVKTTTAGAKGKVRLRPEAIYQIAKDREDALRLLRRFGYLL
jgi:hypothetical protein